MALGHAAGIVAATGGTRDQLVLGTMVIGLGNAVGGFAAGWLADRWPVRILLVVAAVFSASVLALIAITMIPVALNFVMGTLVAAAGRQPRANVFIVVVTAANLALNAMLIPRWGVNGAALTTLATEVLLAAASAWVTRDLWMPRAESGRR